MKAFVLWMKVYEGKMAASIRYITIRQNTSTDTLPRILCDFSSFFHPPFSHLDPVSCSSVRSIISTMSLFSFLSFAAVEVTTY